MPRSHRPTVLCILDGWGTRPNTPDNAIAQAETPVWDALLETCPHGTLASSGEAVGLPPGQMGNSEVGHMNLGAGRVVMQDLPRIDKAIQDGSLAKNRTLRDIIATLHKTGGTCHLTGLVSPGGVHSHQRHFVALARFLSEEGIPVSIHAFMDGRDTPPSSGKGYLQALQKDLEEMKNVSISTVSGRFYAMDRDKRWERVEKAWRALVLAEGTPAASPIAAMEATYTEGITDEFVVPAVMEGYTGMADGDGVIMVNFRADRAREIMAALCDRNFSDFPRPAFPELAACAGMTEYAAEYNTFLDTLFPPESLSGLLGEVVAAAGGSQLRIAETEKYAHVTFF